MDTKEIVAVPGEGGPATRRGQRPRLPLSWLLVGVAVLAYLWTALQEAMVYDRLTILAGQWWRLVTGHWVHVSPRHLMYDALAFGISGWLIEQQSRRQLAVLCGWSALLIGLSVFVLHPEVRSYSGLSGLACATTAYLALLGISGKGTWRWVCAMLLGLLVTKIGWEWIAGRPLFLEPDVAQLVVLPFSHAVGAMSALVIWGATCRQVSALQIDGATSI